MNGLPLPPAVSICIPTWQAQDFISRTLDFASRQSHQQLRILVSVDQCDDATAGICHDYARRDGRIEVFVQPQRLGWARNTNFLLDRVATEFFFLYFHDDVIEPNYVERMLQALQERPDVLSVHCDMGHFGASQHVSRGLDYPGSAANRLGLFLLAPERGSPLRSLTRAIALDAGLRLPSQAVEGLWANEPYLMQLLAMGPAMRVPETLYLRWDKRAGGLTDGWRGLSLEQQYSGYRNNVSAFLAIIDATAMSEGEREALRFCLYVHLLPRIRAIEESYPDASPRPAADIHPAFAKGEVPVELSLLGPRLETWALERHAQLAAQ